MKRVFFYLLIFSLLVSCSEKKDPVSNNNSIDTLVKQPENTQIDSIKNVPTREVYYDSVPTIRIAYVIADTGLAFMEKPDTASKKLGTFELGTKVYVTEETGIPLEIKKKGKPIKGQWVKVKARTHKDYESSWYEHFQFSGYVFDGLLVDSLKADFRKIPITERDSVFTPTVEKTLKLKFKTIQEAEFLKHKKNYSNQLVVDSSVFRIKNKENQYLGFHFILKTARFQFRYNNKRFRGYNYYGKISPTDLYCIHWTGDEIGGYELLDSVTSITYDIILKSEERYSGPLVSPKGTKILFFSGDESLDTVVSAISLYKISNTSKRFEFKETFVYLSKEWGIQEIVWIDEKSFALKAAEIIPYQGNNPPEPNTLFRIATIE